MNLFDRANRFMLKQWLRADKRFALARVCREHVDRSLYQNNSDISTNGETAFLTGYVAQLKNGVVFDVGANVGDWAALVLAINPSITVHCFEPHPETFSKLQQATTGNSNVALYNFGLSSNETSGTLYSVDIDSGMSSLYQRTSVIPTLGLTERPPTQIRLRKLDDVCREMHIGRIHLLKIDTEGNENDVLLGARSSLEKKMIDAIQFEYGGTWIDARKFLIDTWTMLEEFRYQMYKITPRGLASCPRYEPEYENFQYCNYVALSGALDIPESLLFH